MSENLSWWRVVVVCAILHIALFYIIAIGFSMMAFNAGWNAHQNPILYSVLKNRLLAWLLISGLPYLTIAFIISAFTKTDKLKAFLCAAAISNFIGAAINILNLYRFFTHN